MPCWSNTDTRPSMHQSIILWSKPLCLQTKSKICETTYLWLGLQEGTTVWAGIVHCCCHVNYSLFAAIGGSYVFMFRSKISCICVTAQPNLLCPVGDSSWLHSFAPAGTREIYGLRMQQQRWTLISNNSSDEISWQMYLAVIHNLIVLNTSIYTHNYGRTSVCTKLISYDKNVLQCQIFNAANIIVR